MGLFDFTKNRDINLKINTIKSGKDLGISTDSLIYIENEYDTVVNEYLSKNYNVISAKLCHYNKSGNLIYLPNSIDDIFDNQGGIMSLLKYYYPNIKIEGDYFDKVQSAISTAIFTNIAFSFLGYEEIVTPGFLRFVEKRTFGQEYEYIYEYIQLDLSSDINLEKQVTHSIEKLFESIPSLDTSSRSCHSDSGGSDGFYPSLFGDYEDDDYIPENKTKDNDFKGDESLKARKKDREILEEKMSQRDSDSFTKSKTYSKIRKIFDESFWLDEDATVCKKAKEDLTISPSSTKIVFEKNPEYEKPVNQLFDSSTKLIEEEYHDVRKCAIEKMPYESELIARIREDIMTVKVMGFLDLLIKEVGPTLFEDKEEIHKESRLIMDDYYRIFLPDFNNMEIDMHPLPKALFILFLRHPEGILLKDIHDYKKELLKIYNSITNKGDLDDIEESIDRICDPSDGSIHEKISRIKEAFIKNMSIDTAKNYIVTGERGKIKKILLSRPLLQLPQKFEEITLTGVR